jgi:hypothetical protein
MSRLVCLAALALSAPAVALSTSAAAEVAAPAVPPRVSSPLHQDPSGGYGYVGAFAEIGYDVGIRGAAGVELAVRPTGEGIWYRARVGKGFLAEGPSTDAEYYQALLGVEHRRCAAVRIVCGAVALDAGALRLDHDDDVDATGSADRSGWGATVQPRASLELGILMRLRLSLSIPLTYADATLGAGVIVGTSLMVGN